MMNDVTNKYKIPEIFWPLKAPFANFLLALQNVIKKFHFWLTMTTSTCQNIRQ